MNTVCLGDTNTKKSTARLFFVPVRWVFLRNESILPSMLLSSLG